MDRIQLFVSLLLILTVSCTRKKEEAPIPQSDECLLLTETLNDKPFRTYEYNENRQLYRIVQYGSSTIQKRYTFEYDQKNRVSVFRETSLVAPFNNFQYNIFYSGENKIDSVRKFSITNAGAMYQQSYYTEYDSQNKLIRYSWANNYWRYEYDTDGNIAKWYVKLANSTKELILAEYSNYDAMKSLFSHLQPMLLVNLIRGEYRGDHNFGSYKLYESGGTVSQTAVITYLYNAFKLPTEASLSVFYVGGGTFTDVYKYTYECL